MRLGTFFKTAALSTMTLAATSCGKGQLTRVAEHTPLTHVIDSLTIVNKEIPKDTTYKFLKTDTVKLNKKLYAQLKANPDSFMNTLNKKGIYAAPWKEVGKIIDFQNILGTSIAPNLKPTFINTKAIIKGEVLSNSRGSKLYIPVEFYGQPNPEAIVKPGIIHIEVKDAIEKGKTIPVNIKDPFNN